MRKCFATNTNTNTNNSNNSNNTNTTSPVARFIHAPPPPALYKSTLSRTLFGTPVARLTLNMPCAISRRQCYCDHCYHCGYCDHCGHCGHYNHRARDAQQASKSHHPVLATDNKSKEALIQH